ncbi:MAG: hypothetical protein QOG41_2212 [Thermoleophilaceae bacterium]|nr:hypothetical protein [Thermoleophilaceae bacterium]
MPRTRPVFAFYLVLIVGGIVAAIVIGLLRGRDDPGARRAVTRFSAALRQHDGAAACAELSAATIKSLEDQQGGSCDKAVLQLGLSGGRVVKSDVAERSAKVDVQQDGSVFVDQTRKGWLITAFGCKPVKARPYDCEVQE